MSWKLKETWCKSGPHQADGNRDFHVEIVHYLKPGRDGVETRNAWNVYGYVAVSHPLHDRIQGERHWQPALEDAPLHGGVTLLHRESIQPGQHWRPEMIGKPHGIKFGSDYAHLGDEHCEAWEPRDGQPHPAVLADAEALFAWLDGPARVPTTPAEGQE